MQTTTQKYKDNIYAPSRSISGRVTFDISDVTAAGDVTSITTSTESSISVKAQLIDKARNLTFNPATWETDRFKLDGTFNFPDDTLANNGELGFCSNLLSGVGGTFSSAQTMSFLFGSNHSSVGLTITFDRINNEYAVDFNMSAYDASNVLITSTDVTGNTEALVSPIGLLANYRKVVVTITKWCRADRRARVMEVDFGIVRVYTDDSLISMNLVEELDLISSTLPSAEFKFTVDNSLREFNILNPVGFYKYLQERQQVIAELGLEVSSGVYEWVPVGSYLLREWQSNEGSLTTTFTARTNLDLMASFEYENLAASSKTLYAFAVQIFALCGITNYSIDSGLSSITTDSLIEKTNCKNVLQMIAIAACANIFVTRDNIITIQVSPASMGASVDTVLLDDMYQEPQVILDKSIKTVNVTYWTNLATSAVVSVNSALTVGDTLKLENNTLIQTFGRATTVGNWILAQLAYRAIYTVNWRSNPAEELSDVVSLENSYGSDMDAYVTRVELNYAGYLSGKTEARGVAN